LVLLTAEKEEGVKNGQVEMVLKITSWPAFGA